MPKTPTDPLRAQLLELTSNIEQHNARLRDFAVTPGDLWLAKDELGQLMSLLSDMENLLEDIKRADAENGY